MLLSKDISGDCTFTSTGTYLENQILHFIVRGKLYNYIVNHANTLGKYKDRLQD